MTIIYIPLEISIPPYQLYQYIREHVQDSFLLESGAGSKQKAELSILGFDPEKIISLDQASQKDIFSILRSELQNHQVSDSGKYIGGLVGTFSYDAFRAIENLPDHAPQDKKFPDALFGLFLDGIVYDHLKNKVQYFYQSEIEDRSFFIKDFIQQINKEPLSKLRNDSNPRFQCNDLEYECSKDHFAKNVALIKEKIRNGETYQTVYSQRISTSFKGDPYAVYLRLREINPSPYLFFIDLKGYQVFGSSPETLVSVHNNTVRTFPLAGTRRLGAPEERDFLKQDLLNDPKEQAEHNMLVDLGRNDLGKVCTFGSVHVPRYMEIHEFSHVIHIASIVEGQLRDDKDSIDALKAVFPAGTVSGAPKIRSMEIIDEVENMRRGPYAGAAGYLSFNNNMDLAIAIRTFYTVNNRLYLQAGSGIVIDSDPVREYEETKHKLQALLVALNQSQIKEVII
ncbi:MAG: anthranilate synthase component I family protein [Promethearchaeota archaeon]